ncbi:MAG: 50S ribosomal protein L19 [Elusimicrobia bacterium RIFOXYC2_FULL_34_12]|nr:MAG: 50S ribosomal protein L19 [Elusimicrobia bacterium RIFOXYC2_FULL_34_12]OGS39027.1 MAG: 50S ribosomal protein L19 [Elusimicrobia bacterium RIFOXYD2_FULL_34_30]HAM39690.1 50S ribosomal protein L19 [Elusimicrobiota bacterium]
MENLISVVESQYAKKSMTEINSGDLIKVYYKIIEGDSERTQVFEGTVLRIRGAGNSKTMTVRKISFGIGVERVFMLNSPRLEKIELMKHRKVRRSRLYYLRGLSGKSARMEERTGKEQSQGTKAP